MVSLELVCSSGGRGRILNLSLVDVDAEGSLSLVESLDVTTGEVDV